MAFRPEKSLTAVRPVLLKYPVANGITITKGDVVRLVNGRFDQCATNENVFGVSVTEGAIVGDAAGTTEITAQLALAWVFEVPQGAVLADANVQPGDYCDINATSDGITTAANNDCKVWAHDAEKNLVYVTFDTPAGGF